MISISQLQEYNLTAGQLNLLFRLRTIWRDMATWMQAYLVYVFLDAPPELVRSAKDKLNDLPITYANIFRIYFGDAMADQHSMLMSNYTNLLISLIDATKLGDTDAINEYTEQILTHVNPFWEATTLSNLLVGFNDRAISEINSLANENYQGNTDIFSSLLSYSDRMGDFFTDGILKYFTFSSREPRMP